MHNKKVQSCSENAIGVEETQYASLAEMFARQGDIQLVIMLLLI